MDWQPIETAPKDEFILLYEDGMMRCGLWENGGWHPAEIPVLIDKSENMIVSRELQALRGERLILSGFVYEPTHWMPLPEPPQVLDARQTSAGRIGNGKNFGKRLTKGAEMQHVGLTYRSLETAVFCGFQPYTVEKTPRKARESHPTGEKRGSA